MNLREGASERQRSQPIDPDRLGRLDAEAQKRLDPLQSMDASQREAATEELDRRLALNETTEAKDTWRAQEDTPGAKFTTYRSEADHEAYHVHKETGVIKMCRRGLDGKWVKAFTIIEKNDAPAVVKTQAENILNKQSEKKEKEQPADDWKPRQGGKEYTLYQSQTDTSRVFYIHQENGTVKMRTRDENGKWQSSVDARTEDLPPVLQKEVANVFAPYPELKLGPTKFDERTSFATRIAQVLEEKPKTFTEAVQKQVDAGEALRTLFNQQLTVLNVQLASTNNNIVEAKWKLRMQLTPDECKRVGTVPDKSYPAGLLELSSDEKTTLEKQLNDSLAAQKEISERIQNLKTLDKSGIMSVPLAPREKRADYAAYFLQLQTWVDRTIGSIALTSGVPISSEKYAEALSTTEKLATEQKFIEDINTFNQLEFVTLERQPDGSFLLVPRLTAAKGYSTAARDVHYKHILAAAERNDIPTSNRQFQLGLRMWNRDSLYVIPAEKITREKIRNFARDLQKGLEAQPEDVSNSALIMLNEAFGKAGGGTRIDSQDTQNVGPAARAAYLLDKLITSQQEKHGMFLSDEGNLEVAKGGGEVTLIEGWKSKILASPGVALTEFAQINTSLIENPEYRKFVETAVGHLKQNVGVLGVYRVPEEAMKRWQGEAAKRIFLQDTHQRTVRLLSNRLDVLRQQNVEMKFNTGEHIGNKLLFFVETPIDIEKQRIKDFRESGILPKTQGIYDELVDGTKWAEGKTLDEQIRYLLDVRNEGVFDNSKARAALDEFMDTSTARILLKAAAEAPVIGRIPGIIDAGIDVADGKKSWGQAVGETAIGFVPVPGAKYLAKKGKDTIVKKLAKDAAKEGLERVVQNEVKNQLFGDDK